MHIAQGHVDPLKGCLQLELILKGLKQKRPKSLAYHTLDSVADKETSRAMPL